MRSGTDRTRSIKAARLNAGDSRGGQAGMLMRPGSGREGAGRRSEQLEQVVSEADEGPLAADLAEAAQPESAKAAPLLDLPEHGFRDGLAPGIHRPARRGLQLAPHRLAEGPVPAAPRRGVPAVWVPIRRDVEVNRR